MQVLKATERDLRQKEEALQTLNGRYESAVQQLQARGVEVERAQQKSEAARKLLDLLDSKRKRWKEDLVLLREEELNLCGDAALCAVFLNYCGCFSQTMRVGVIQDMSSLIQKGHLHHSLACNSWEFFEMSLNLLAGGDTRVTNLAECDRLEWIMQGLNHDLQSVQNALISSWIIAGDNFSIPLLIDPHQF
jgi:hypothetical protein